MASNVFSSVPPFFSSLARLITGDIDCSHSGLKSHSVDGSPYAIRPQAVLYPKTSTDIKHAVAFAREYRIPLTVCGGGTAGTGGSLGEGIVIDMTRYFSQIRHVNMMEHTVTVDAGVRIDELREKLASWGMEIPVLEEEHSRATVGGLVATKSATPRTFYAGTIRDWVEGMTIVVDSGEEHHIKDAVTPSGRLLGIYQSIFPLLSEEGATLRAAKREASDDATGYSLWNTSIGPRQLIDQLVGSEGTLAIITSITLRVTPIKEHTLTTLIPVANEQLLATYTDIAKHHQSESLFFFDATFRKLADTFHPGIIPESLPNTAYYLAVGMRHNNAETLHAHMKLLTKATDSKQEEIWHIDEKQASRLTNNAFLHSLFYDYSKGTYMVATVGEGIIVSPHVYESCVRSLDELMSKTGHLYTLTGYTGSGHIALTTAFDAKSLSYEADLQTYREEILKIVQSYKGGISAVGGDGLERTTALPFIYNEATRSIFKKVKECWDPLHIFNPGKKLSITKDYLVKQATRTLT